MITNIPLRNIESRGSISKGFAAQFFEECYEFTNEFVDNYIKDLVPLWSPTNKLPRKEFTFTPEGAVIHMSNSPSIANTLRLQTQHVYGSHFIVCSGKHINISKSRYPLLHSMPTLVFMPYKIDDIIQHSWYMSSKTWGIELRNSGLLRPHIGHGSPVPITKAEETDRNFRAFEKADSYHWQRNMWTERFPGTVYSWKGYKFEVPTRHQIDSLAIVLRLLDVFVGGLNKDFIVPSNCINGRFPSMPIMNWDYLRRTATWEYRVLEDKENKKTSTWITELFPNEKTDFEDYELEDENESSLALQMGLSRWRGEFDNGSLLELDTGRIFDKIRRHKVELDLLGYNTVDLDSYTTSMKMYSIAKNIGLSNMAELNTRIKMDLAKFNFSSLKYGNYDTSIFL